MINQENNNDICIIMLGLAWKCLNMKLKIQGLESPWEVNFCLQLCKSLKNLLFVVAES